MVYPDVAGAERRRKPARAQWKENFMKESTVIKQISTTVGFNESSRDLEGLALVCRHLQSARLIPQKESRGCPIAQNMEIPMTFTYNAVVNACRLLAIITILIKGTKSKVTIKNFSKLSAQNEC
jgi:hypothetical protein